MKLMKILYNCRCLKCRFEQWIVLFRKLLSHNCTGVSKQILIKVIFIGTTMCCWMVWVRTNRLVVQGSWYQVSSACPNEIDELGARWLRKYHDNKDELLELLECREEYFLNWNEIQKSTYFCLKEAICTVLLWISFIWHKCLRLLLTTVSERSWIW